MPSGSGSTGPDPHRLLVQANIAVSRSGRLVDVRHPSPPAGTFDAHPLGAPCVLAGAEATMADKSPRQTASKKSGKTLKEKRAEKKAKQAGKTDSAIHIPHR